MRKYIAILMISVCALLSGAQTLNSEYVALADSADRYMEASRWADAERVIERALRVEPANKSNYLLWSNLGMVRLNLERFQDAITAFDIGLVSAPKSVTLLTNRGKAYLALGDASRALSDMEQALQLDSTLQWPAKMKGILLAAVGNRDAAKSALVEYESKYGVDRSVSETLGDLWLGENDASQAMDCYKKAYDAEADADLLIKLLLSANVTGKLNDYADLIRLGIDAYPKNGMLHLIRALLYKERYQTDAMESDLKMAREFGVDKQTIDLLINCRK